MSLLDLGTGPLSVVLKGLTLAEICSVAQTCKALWNAAQDDSVWHALALERYPAETVRIGEHYATYQELVRDDNTEQAVLLLPLDLGAPDRAAPGAAPCSGANGGSGGSAGQGSQCGDGCAGGGGGAESRGGEGRSCACRYKFNRQRRDLPAGGYYECLVLALEWDRASHTFRLYFEARGEADLRHPGESSLGFTVHRQPPPDRRALERHLAHLQQRRQQLQRDLDAALARDGGESIRRAQHELARNATQQQQAQLELGRQHELRFSDLLTVVRPAGQHLLLSTREHKLGCLTFDSLHKIDVLLRELPDSYASKQHAAVNGIDLCFCYANPIPVMPHGAIVDYEPTCLLTLPPGAKLLDAFRRRGRYTAPRALMQELREEGPEARRRRWDHVPPEVLGRQPPWLV